MFFHVIDGYAPFLSMTSRETFLNIKDQVVAAPGPGHYDPAYAQDVVKVYNFIFTEGQSFFLKILEWDKCVKREM